MSVYCKLIQQIRATKREFCTIKVNNNNNNNNNDNYRTFIIIIGHIQCTNSIKCSNAHDKIKNKIKKAKKLKLQLRVNLQ